MVNKKFEIKWRSRFCSDVIVFVVDNVHELAGAISSIISDENSSLVDVTTFECYDH